MSDIENGDLVKDNITGFEGIVICTTTYLSGCDRVVVQPQKVNKETGLPIEPQAFDVTQLKILKKAAIKQYAPIDPAKLVAEKKGGPRPIAGRTYRTLR